MKDHHYQTHLRWTGNTGQGTTQYNAYSRNHEVSGEGKSIAIPCSSDSHFRGDAARYNPEELFLASLSTCHMLWYLHLCATHNVVVTAYEDNASATMVEAEDGSGHFSDVLLRPVVAIAPESDHATALRLHEEANRMCFIANSVRFTVRHEPVIRKAHEAAKAS